jgi:hypothetical protein
MSEQQSKQPFQEELAELRKQFKKQVLVQFSPEELGRLRDLSRESIYKLLQRYLAPLALATDRVWEKGLSERDTDYLRGVRYVLERLNGLGEEMELTLERLREEEKEEEER